MDTELFSEAFVGLADTMDAGFPPVARHSLVHLPCACRRRWVR
jgi:hypothetical protein